MGKPIIYLSPRDCIEPDYSKIPITFYDIYRVSIEITPSKVDGQGAKWDSMTHGQDDLYNLIILNSINP